MKKIFSIISASIFAGLFVSCNVSDKQVSPVTIDFNSSHVNAGLPGYSSSGSATTTVVPADVVRIQLKIYASTKTEENVIFSQTFERSAVDSNGTVAIDVLSGPSRIFVVNAFDNTGVVKYDNSLTPSVADLVADTDISVPVVMNRVNTIQDAAFNLKLLAEGTVNAAYPDPGYLDNYGSSSSAATFKAEVYIPTIVNGSVNLSNPLPLSKSIIVGTTFTSAITGMSAYPQTYQVVVVRAFTADGNIAAIGSAIIQTLVSGNNPDVEVQLVRPGSLAITSLSGNIDPSLVRVQMIIGSGYQTVATSGTVDMTMPNVAVVLVPNSVSIWGKAADVPSKTLLVGISLNAGDTYKYYTFDGISNPYIRWSTVPVNY